jgi:hypothetical protein
VTARNKLKLVFEAARKGPRDYAGEAKAVDRSQGSAEWAGAKFRILHFTRSFGSAAHSVGRTLRGFGRGLARAWAVGVGRGEEGGTIVQKGDNFFGCCK